MLYLTKWSYQSSAENQAMGTSTAGDQFDQIEVSKNLSQLIRSNTPHYWAYMKHTADLTRLQPYLSFKGTIAGDPHMGNFAALPLKSVGGSRKMRFVNVDFDDAGRGPFVLDLVRYLVAVKSITGQIKKRPLEASYVAGLAGKEVDPPKEVRSLLAMLVSDYDEMVTRYAEKKSSKHGFELKAGEIEPYNAKIGRSTIEHLFPTEKVIDLAMRPAHRGGSLGQLRIWVLAEDKNSRRRIVELKQYARPATANYQTQPPVHEWLSEIRQSFWPGLDGSAYDLIDLAGAGLFWIREKHVSLIDLPYSSTKSSDIAFLEDLAIYDANVLGLAHGRQAQAAPYHAVVKREIEALHDATEAVAKAYLATARESLHDK
jgi:Uncharacterized protein conserved in bacteria (DUF2252)